MFERLLQDAPQFFAGSNLLFIAQAMGRTLAMSLIGCGVGLLFGLLSISHGPKEFVHTDRIVDCAAIYARTAATVLAPRSR